MVYPKFLKPNDTIGITATSMGITDNEDIERLDDAIKNLTNLGYKVKETDNVRKNACFVSSDAATRAKEFIDLWEDKDVKAIITATGGEFLMEILPYLDVEKIKNTTPKWVEGYSDTSLLLYYLTTNFDIATLHSVNAKSFSMEPVPKCIENTINILKGNIVMQESFPLYEKERLTPKEYNLTEEVIYKHLYNKATDTLKGRLIGGCIDALKTLFGTQFDNTKNFVSKCSEGVIWYLDNYELSLMEFYRTIWQMKQAGWLKNVNGILIGRTSIARQVWDLSYETMLHNAFDDLNVPVIYDVDISHLSPQLAIINGSLGTFKFDNGKGKLEQQLL